MVLPNGPVGTDEFWSLSVGRLWRHKFLQQQVERRVCGNLRGGPWCGLPTTDVRRRVPVIFQALQMAKFGHYDPIHIIMCSGRFESEASINNTLAVLSTLTLGDGCGRLQDSTASSSPRR